VGTRGPFPTVKAVWSWSWPLISIYCQGQEWWSNVNAPPYFFMTYCIIKYRDNFTYTSPHYNNKTLHVLLLF
jgi:hypothetical protein